MRRAQLWRVCASSSGKGRNAKRKGQRSEQAEAEARGDTARRTGQSCGTLQADFAAQFCEDLAHERWTPSLKADTTVGVDAPRDAARGLAVLWCRTLSHCLALRPVLRKRRFRH